MWYKILLESKTNFQLRINILLSIFHKKMFSMNFVHFSYIRVPEASLLFPCKLEGMKWKYLTSREPSRGDKLTLQSLVWRSGTDPVTDFARRSAGFIIGGCPLAIFDTRHQFRSRTAVLMLGRSNRTELLAYSSRP